MRWFSLLFLLLMVVGKGCIAPVAGGRVAALARPTVSNSTGPKITYLALGDSYTIGEGVGEANRWPVQLAALARQEGLAVQPPDIIARTGWTTAELQAAIGEAHNQRQYDLVSLMIGVNNQYRGQSVVQYRAEFRELLRTAVGFAGGRRSHVFVLSIPDWSQSPFGQRQSSVRVSAEIDQFNAAAQEECREAGIAFVDITPLTRAAAGDSRQFAHDGLHYAAPQLHDWAGQALPVVRLMLNSASGGSK